MSHLTQEQRYTISVLLQQGKSVDFISSTISRHRSVVYRELERNSSPKGYDYDKAQHMYQKRINERKRHIRLTDSIKDIIREWIRQDYSPEQIVGRARREGIDFVSIPTVYKFIEEDKQDYRISGEDKLYRHLRIVPRRTHKRRGKAVGVGIIPDRVMIDSRPEWINNRSRFGDFEADTMWIADKACMLTLVDRKSGLAFIRALPDRKSESILAAFKDIARSYNGKIHSITVDNGKEFYRHRIIAEALQTDIYFANPYRSGERGTNENTNGLYRQYLPRKTKIDSLSAEYIQLIENKINSRPRKRLGFKTPTEYISDEFENKFVAFKT